jgi:hypothetical protein
MVVTITADGALVQGADDCARLHVETALGVTALRTAVHHTGIGRVDDDGAVWLDVAVLRARARLAAPADDWPDRWSALVARAERAGALSADGLALRVAVERAGEDR